MGRNRRCTRREFLERAGLGLAAISIVPRWILGGEGRTAPSDKLSIACVGVGGRGAEDLNGVFSERVVGLCDVDALRLDGAAMRVPGAKKYRDYRLMLDKLGTAIDAVVVATPDHTHSTAAMTAIRLGKHVYCEKPLAHSIGEVRALAKAAAERKVVTQLGNQGHSFDSIRSFREWVEAGTIGSVRTVHAFCNSNYSRVRQIERVRAETPPVPPELEWDLWLGPAQARPYHRAYHPGTWRGWMPFGTGVFGDWVCHVVDPVFWTLDLGAPESVEAQADGFDPERHGDTFPPATEVRFEFPAKGKRGPVTLVWFDGTRKPPVPDGFDGWDESTKGLPGIGAAVLGDGGTIVYGSHGASGLRLVPKERMKGWKEPPPTIPRVTGHHQDWLEAIRKGRPAGSGFEYGGQLTEIALLGVIATRFPGRKLRWDGARMEFTDFPEADRFLKPSFREGWTL